MKISAAAFSLKPADALCLSVFKEEIAHLPKLLKDLDVTLNQVISSAVADHEFSGKEGEIIVFHTQKKSLSKKLLITGLGKKKDYDLETVRRIASRTAQRVRGLKCKTVNVLLPATENDLSEKKIAQAFTEGAVLGLWSFSGILSKKPGDKDEPDFAITSVTLMTEHIKGLEKIEEGIHRGQKIAEACNLARELSMLPSNFLTPSTFAKKASDVAKKTPGLKATIHGASEIKKLKMGSLWGVAKGSVEEPKLIVLEYQGASAKEEKIALIGKGVCFDSGGISIKPAKGMKEMTGDMAGGATVLGAIQAAAQLKLKVNLIAIIPAVENMPGGKAQKPGDVVTAMNGKTIEVINTDAEGRLILCDAMTYAQKLGAKKMIDFATLTGGVIISLGHLFTGVLSNNQNFVEDLIKSSKNAGEKFWQLPLHPDYFKLLKSDIADMTNCLEGGEASTITAAEFLHQFVEEGTKWIHCDIAGTADVTSATAYYAKGATGVGIRTLIEYLS
jgi:leucyl aminopeptidase